MPEQRRIAVIVVRNDPAAPWPNMADVMDLVLYSPSSIVRYFRDTAEDHFLLSPLDFHGPYDVTLPPAPDTRNTAIARARDAATNAGVALGGYDGTVVLGFPGTGYDAGADGIGSGAAVFLPATSDFTFFCHEIGHVLGFDHTYGIPTTGADWSDDGIDQLYPVYGDPYDLMSSATFGGASSPGTRPAADVPAAFPSWASSPPHLSRALLHVTRPSALEDRGKVRHVFEGGTDEIFTLHPVGHGVDGDAELVVFHPANEDDRGRGRVYAEYRQPFDFNAGSRWDAGLADVGEPGALDRCGVVVHTVVDAPGTSTPVVWYSGRIVFPSPDTDAAVDTPQGAAVVSVSPDFAQTTRPGYVRVRVNRHSAPTLTVLSSDADEVTVTSSERRPHPGWEWAGDFTYETRETVRTTTYTPVTTGIGGRAPVDAESSAVVSWFVGGEQVFGASGTLSVVPDGGATPVELAYTLHASSRVLTLANRPSDGSFQVTVTGRASDSAGADEAFAGAVYAVDGRSEGWGEDWDRFMDFWYRITHPIPIGDLVPHPDPGDPLHLQARLQLDRIRTEYQALRAANPVLAEQLQPLVVDQERVLGRYAIR